MRNTHSEKFTSSALGRSLCLGEGPHRSHKLGQEYVGPCSGESQTLKLH